MIILLNIIILCGIRPRSLKMSSRNITYEYSVYKGNDSKHRTKPYSIKRCTIFWPPLDTTTHYVKVADSRAPRAISDVHHALLHTMHYAKTFMCINSFNFHDNPK